MSEPRATPGSNALLSDAELIERVLAGEPDCFQPLVQRYQASLYRVACALVLDPDAAADIVQDAFVRAYANLARCHDRRRFRFWLLATLRNRGLDYLKERRRRDLSLSDDAVVRRAELTDVVTSDAAGERVALRRALDAALARLSPPLRETFVLRHVEQWSVDEIAELLGLTESAVKMRLHRARLQLQDWLEADGLAGEEDVTRQRDESSME
jgi:RNA polymerase sigma factor (sigma-70 family)